MKSSPLLCALVLSVCLTKTVDCFTPTPTPATAAFQVDAHTPSGRIVGIALGVSALNLTTMTFRVVDGRGALADSLSTLVRQLYPLRWLLLRVPASTPSFHDVCASFSLANAVAAGRLAANHSGCTGSTASASCAVLSLEGSYASAPLTALPTGSYALCLETTDTLGLDTSDAAAAASATAFLNGALTRPLLLRPGAVGVRGWRNPSPALQVYVFPYPNTSFNRVPASGWPAAVSARDSAHVSAETPWRAAGPFARAVAAVEAGGAAVGGTLSLFLAPASAADDLSQPSAWSSLCEGAAGAGPAVAPLSGPAVYAALFSLYSVMHTLRPSQAVLCVGSTVSSCARGASACAASTAAGVGSLTVAAPPGGAEALPLTAWGLAAGIQEWQDTSTAGGVFFLPATASPCIASAVSPVQSAVMGFVAPRLPTFLLLNVGPATASEALFLFWLSIFLVGLVVIWIVRCVYLIIRATLPRSKAALWCDMQTRSHDHPLQSLGWLSFDFPSNEIHWFSAVGPLLFGASVVVLTSSVSIEGAPGGSEQYLDRTFITPTLGFASQNLDMGSTGPRILAACVLALCVLFLSAINVCACFLFQSDRSLFLAQLQRRKRLRAATLRRRGQSGQKAPSSTTVAEDRAVVDVVHGQPQIPSTWRSRFVDARLPFYAQEVALRNVFQRLRFAVTPLPQLCPAYSAGFVFSGAPNVSAWIGVVRPFQPSGASVTILRGKRFAFWKKVILLLTSVGAVEWYWHPPFRAAGARLRGLLGDYKWCGRWGFIVWLNMTHIIAAALCCRWLHCRTSWAFASAGWIFLCFYFLWYVAFVSTSHRLTTVLYVAANAVASLGIMVASWNDSGTSNVSSWISVAVYAFIAYVFCRCFAFLNSIALHYGYQRWLLKQLSPNPPYRPDRKLDDHCKCAALNPFKGSVADQVESSKQGCPLHEIVAAEFDALTWMGTPFIRRLFAKLMQTYVFLPDETAVTLYPKSMERILDVIELPAPRNVRMLLLGHLTKGCHETFRKFHPHARKIAKSPQATCSSAYFCGVLSALSVWCGQVKELDALAIQWRNTGRSFERNALLQELFRCLVQLSVMRVPPMSLPCVSSCTVCRDVSDSVAGGSCSSPSLVTSFADPSSVASDISITASNILEYMQNCESAVITHSVALRWYSTLVLSLAFGVVEPKLGPRAAGLCFDATTSLWHLDRSRLVLPHDIHIHNPVICPVNPVAAALPRTLCGAAAKSVCGAGPRTVLSTVVGTFSPSPFSDIVRAADIFSSRIPQLFLAEAVGSFCIAAASRINMNPVLTPVSWICELDLLTSGMTSGFGQKMYDDLVGKMFQVARHTSIEVEHAHIRYLLVQVVASAATVLTTVTQSMKELPLPDVSVTLSPFEMSSCVTVAWKQRVVEAISSLASYVIFPVSAMKSRPPEGVVPHPWAPALILTASSTTQEPPQLRSIPTISSIVLIYQVMVLYILEDPLEHAVSHKGHRSSACESIGDAKAKILQLSRRINPDPTAPAFHLKVQQVLEGAIECLICLVDVSQSLSAAMSQIYEEAQACTEDQPDQKECAFAIVAWDRVCLSTVQLIGATIHELVELALCAGVNVSASLRHDLDHVVLPYLCSTAHDATPQPRLVPFSCPSLAIITQRCASALVRKDETKDISASEAADALPRDPKIERNLKLAAMSTALRSVANQDVLDSIYLPSIPPYCEQSASREPVFLPSTTLPLTEQQPSYAPAVAPSIFPGPARSSLPKIRPTQRHSQSPFRSSTGVHAANATTNDVLRKSPILRSVWEQAASEHAASTADA